MKKSYVRTRLSAIPECGWQWAILLLIQRVIRRMKELVLQLSLLGLSPVCFFFLSPARHLTSGSRCSRASCTGGQAFRLAGYFLYLAHSLGAIPFVCHPLSSPKEKRSLLFFSPENLYLFVLILFASVGPTQQRPYTRSSPIVLRLIPSYRAKSLFRPFLG